MEIVLVPGLWLDGSTWDQVVPHLEKGGHRARPLTLPGMGSADADRSTVSWQDHVDAVVAALDAADGEVALVGHSFGGMVAYCALDVRPDRVARIVFVGSEPADARPSSEDGGGFPLDGADAPLPDWSFFDDEMVADLDDAQRAAVRERSVPSPARVITDAFQLSDDRRRDVPATVVACEYPVAQLKKWIDDGEEGVAELARLRNVEYVDLFSGHWPQVSRPDDLADVILTSLRAG
jgi:pimeloyl-ACP methyl ester carboxylesterase